MSKNDCSEPNNKKGIEVSKSIQQKSRRKALKTTLAGSAIVTASSVPTKWVAPVVDSVLLPAHAATSQLTTWFGTVSPLPGGSMTNYPEKDNFLYASVNESKNVLGTVVSSIADILIEPANAQSSSAYCCVKKNGDGITATYQYVSDFEIINFTGTGMLGGNMDLEATCDIEIVIVALFTEKPGDKLECALYFNGYPKGGAEVSEIPRAPCALSSQNCAEGGDEQDDEQDVD